jgi:hypothetical protein
MPKELKISTLFPKHLFWDMNYEQLNSERDKDIIIPRALYMTNKQSFNEDIQKLEYLYTPTQIISQLKTTKEMISNEVCELVAKRYNIPVFYRFNKK